MTTESATREEISEIAHLLLIANTPHFLFRRLLENYTVQKLASAFSVEEIESRLESLSRGDSPSVEDSAMLFALIASLAVKGTKESTNVLRGIDLPHLRWFEELRNMAVSQELTSAGIYEIGEKGNSPPATAITNTTPVSVYSFE